MLDAKQIIDLLGLKPLPMEGGFYTETYRSADRLAADALPGRYKSDKDISTAIYYLLTPETRSMMHRLPTDEIYHFYIGDPVRMLLLEPDGNGKEIVFGSNIVAGQHVQVVVPRDVWQGSLLVPGGKFALMGTTVAPGFDFDDYEPGDRDRLVQKYPSFKELITRLTR